MTLKRKILTEEEFVEKYEISMPKDGRQREMDILGFLSAMQLNPPDTLDDLRHRVEGLKEYMLDTKHLPYFDFISKNN